MGAAIASKKDGDHDLTTSNKILVVAHRLAQSQETFTAEDLIVQAWKEFPESFGLSGYRELYPDSNRVLSKLMGSVGLCSRGWLEQVSTKTYRITPGGRKFATALRTAPADARRESSGRGTNVPPAPRASGASATSRASVPSVPPATERRSSVPAEPVVAAKGERRSSVPSAPAKPDRKSTVPYPPAPVAAAPAPKSAPVTPPVPARTSHAPSAPKSAPVAAAASARSSAPPAREPIKTSSSPIPAPAPVTASAPVASGTEFDALPTLTRLAMSVAAQKFTRGALVTFQDAGQFWAINASTHPRNLATRLDEINQLLKRAEVHIQQTGASIRVNDRTELTLTTVIGLQGLHRMLTQRYNRELENIRARAGSGDDDDDEE